MSGKKKSNRKFRSLKMESLEKRELMAGDVTASVDNGVLNVRGTEGRDVVEVRSFSGLTNILSNGKSVKTFKSSEYSSINVDMRNGNDRLSISMIDKDLSKIDVNMGKGSSEWMDIRVGYTKNVKIDAVQSVATHANLSGTIDKAIIDFGADDGRDVLNLRASIVYLDAKFGGGNDTLDVRHSSIQSAAVNMGSGNDQVDIWTMNSQIASGFVDGGEGRRDRFRKIGSGSAGGVAVSNFEW